MDKATILKNLGWNQSIIDHFLAGTLPEDVDGLCDIFLYVPEQQPEILARLDGLCQSFESWQDIGQMRILPAALAAHFITRMIEYASTLDEWISTWEPIWCECASKDDPRLIEAEGAISRLATTRRDWELVQSRLMDILVGDCDCRLWSTVQYELGEEEKHEPEPKSPGDDHNTASMLQLLNARMRDTAPLEQQDDTVLYESLATMLADKDALREHRQTAEIAVRESHLSFRDYRDFLVYIRANFDNMHIAMFVGDVFENKAVEAATTISECLEILLMSGFHKHPLLMEKLCALATRYEHWLAVYRAANDSENNDLRLLAFNHLMTFATA